MTSDCSLRGYIVPTTFLGILFQKWIKQMNEWTKEKLCYPSSCTLLRELDMYEMSVMVTRSVEIVQGQGRRKEREKVYTFM